MERERSGAARHWDTDDLRQFISRNGAAAGGVLCARLLRRTALPDIALREMVDNQELQRVRRGWYMLPGAHPQVVQAVRAGGVLGCLSALALHGVWTPQQSQLHVRPSRNGPSLKATVRTCSLHQPAAAPLFAVDAPHLALRASAGCCTVEELTAVVDSAVHTGLVRPDELGGLLRHAPGDTRRLLRRVERAESGSESLMRQRLRARHWKVRTQVPIESVGRVDLVVGERLVVEVDSRAHHTSASAYHSDRWRDLRLVALGYVVVRVTWEQVTYELDAVMELLDQLMASGSHRGSVRQLRVRDELEFVA